MLKGLFRGIDKENKEWVYGNLIFKDKKYYIYGWKDNISKMNDYIEVDEPTIGRYMNENDIDDVWIFEGDIVIGDILGKDYPILVTDEYDGKINKFIYQAIHGAEFEIIGNKHDID